jgi:tetratricopeptide (TPR) repeat protein
VSHWRAQMLLLSVAAAMPLTGAARKASEAPTLAELRSRTAPVQPAEAVVADPAQAARSYEDFLHIPDADPGMRAQALRRLGDLKLAEAESLRARDGTVTESADAAAQAAIDAYSRLLEEHPDDAAADSVLYQLARAYESMGDTTSSLATLDRLVTKYPTSAHFDEAEFRRGEAFFGAGHYADAERAYTAVLSHGASSEFREQALYKRGWSLFKQGRDDASNAAFLALLDAVLVSDGRLRPEAELSRPEQELTGDALRALAITYSAADGPASLQESLTRHGAAPYEARLYRALGDLYVEKERYQDGAEAYRAFAARRPLDPDAPLLLVRATHAYEKGGFSTLVLDGKRQLVEQYGPNSEFWRLNAPDIDPDVVAALESSLLDLARHHHALAQKGSAADRDLAVRWYRDYLDGFNDSPQAPATRLLLADLLFEAARYEEAAAEFELAAYSYASNPEAARAGYAALVAYEKAEAQAPESGRASLRMRAVDSSIRYADAFPDQPEVPAVLTRSAKVLFDAGDGERAESVAQRVLALGGRADPAQRRVALTVLAHTYFDGGRYPEAEHAYAELVAQMPADDPQRTEFTDRLAASVYRQAEAKQTAGDTAGAASEFLRVAAVAPGTAAAVKAEYDAAALLIEAQRWNEAATVLERFRASHRGHELEPEVTRKLAVVYLESGRRHEAAVELERVAAETAGNTEVSRAALWQAADLFAATGDSAGARRAYAAYVQRFPAPVDAAIDARQQLADLASAAGDLGERRHWLEELIAADAKAGASRTERSRFLAAQASLELARPQDEAARAIRLTHPLDKSLAAKKTAMEAALTAYLRTADYGIAQFTTASTFAMADLYRDLASALLASERPAGLSAEELEQYELLLEEQAYPFEEKAIATHAMNAARAAEGIYDDWVRQSYAALAEMKPARYARVEALELPPAVTVPPAAPTESTATGSAAIVSEALVALQSGAAAEAATKLEAIAAQDPANAAGLNLLGVAQRRVGRFVDARTAYERSIAVDPSYAAPERNLAILLDLYLDDPTAALPHYERCQALTTGTDKELDAWLVEVRTRLGQVSRTAEARP